MDIYRCTFGYDAQNILIHKILFVCVFTTNMSVWEANWWRSWLDLQNESGSIRSQLTSWMGAYRALIINFQEQQLAHTGEPLARLTPFIFINLAQVREQHAGGSQKLTRAVKRGGYDIWSRATLAGGNCKFQMTELGMDALYFPMPWSNGQNAWARATICTNSVTSKRWPPSESILELTSRVYLTL